MNYRLALLLSLFLVFTSIHAATVTWTNGNGTSIWHDPLNWDTGNIPGVNDVAVFDATNTSDCEIKLDASVKGLTISAGYTGTVSYAEEFTVGSDGISIADGFFVSGSEVLDVAGNLTISNGSFTAPISELTLDGNLTVGVTGIFEHNNGTISFQGGGNRVINTSSNAEFYNLTVSKGNNVSLNLNTGDTVTVLNKLVLENGRFGSGGTVLIDDTCHILSGFDKVKADIRFSGSSNGHYIVDRDNLDFDGGTYVDKENTTDTVFFSTSSGTMYVGDAAYDLTIQGGTIAHEDNASIDMNYRSITIGGNGLWVGSSGQINISSNYTSTGNGSFVHNQGTVVFDGGSDRNYTVNNTNEFFNVAINKSNSKNLNITAGDSMRVINKLLLADGKLNAQGVALVNDTCHILSGFDKVKADIRFSGSGNGHYIVDRDNLDFDGGTYVDKDNTTDTVFFSTSTDTMYVGDAGFDLIITNGILAHPAGAVVEMRYGTISILSNGSWMGSDAEIRLAADLTRTGSGSFIPNSGAFRFVGGRNQSIDLNNGKLLFNDLILDKSPGSRITLNTNDTIHAGNNLILVDGRSNGGYLGVSADVDVRSGFDLGTSALVFMEMGFKT